MMFFKVIGWLSILLAVLALAPNAVPGAMSILAYYFSLAALIIAIVSIKSGNIFYFKNTAIICGIGILTVNDDLRLYAALEQASWQSQLFMYGVYAGICLLGSLYAKKARINKTSSDKIKPTR